MYQPILFKVSQMALYEILEKAADRIRLAVIFAAKGDKETAQRALMAGHHHLDGYAVQLRAQLATHWRNLRFDARYLAIDEEPSRYRVEITSAKGKRVYILDAASRYQLERQVYKLAKAQAGQARLVATWQPKTQIQTAA